MNNDYNYQGGNPQGGRRSARKEPAINKCEFTGLVKPRGNYPELRLIQTKTGGASLKLSLECREPTGTVGEDGYPKMRTTFVPVSVWTNKNINAAMLQGVVTGMKVHVVGRWSNQHYKDSNGQDRNFTECEAYVFEILEQPQAMPQYGAQPSGGYQMPQPPQYGQPQPMPQYGYPQYPGYQMPQPPQYSQQQAMPQPPQYGQAAHQQQGPVPPYYQPPGQAAPAQQPPQYQQAPPAVNDIDLDDMPEAIARG